MSYAMGTTIGLKLGDCILARPAEDRYRDMYGGAVVIEVTVDGAARPIALDFADALTFARHIQLAAEESRAAYAVAQRRRREPSDG